MKDSPFVQEDVITWIEGECYNLEELREIFSFAQTSFEEGIANAYNNDQLDDYLNKVDGYFCAVVYDQKKKKLFLFSDRYGMRLLYYYFKDGSFAWASEVKGILALDGVDKSINETSLSCFMDLGHLVEENTFFHYVKNNQFDLETENTQWYQIDKHFICYFGSCSIYAAIRFGVDNICIPEIKDHYFDKEYFCKVVCNSSACLSKVDGISSVFTV